MASPPARAAQRCPGIAEETKWTTRGEEVVEEVEEEEEAEEEEEEEAEEAPLRGIIASVLASRGACVARFVALQ